MSSTAELIINASANVGAVVSAANQANASLTSMKSAAQNTASSSASAFEALTRAANITKAQHMAAFQAMGVDMTRFSTQAQTSTTQAANSMTRVSDASRQVSQAATQAGQSLGGPLTGGANNASSALQRLSGITQSLGGGLVGAIGKTFGSVDTLNHKLQSVSSTTSATASSTTGSFNSIGAGAVAMGSLVASGVQAAAGAIVQLGQSALGAITDFEKMTAQMEAMTAKELVDLGQFASIDAAFDTASGKAKELLGWTQALAVQSPYEESDVSNTMKVAQAFGFLATQYKTTQEAQKAGVITAQRLTEATMNWGAATGQAGHTLQRVGLIAGQIKSIGKLMGGDSMQLKQVGINLEAAIGASMGKTTQQVIEMREKGLIPADVALKALVSEMEKFGNAAGRQAGTIGGMLASLTDLGKIAQRDLFSGIFNSLKPALDAAITTLQNPAFKQSLQDIGNAAGASVAQALAALGQLASGAQAAFAAFQAGMAAGGVGGGVAALLAKLGLSPEIASTAGAIINQLASVVQTGINAVKEAIAGFQSGGVAGGVGNFLTALGIDPAIVTQVTTTIAQIGAAIQTGIAILKATVAGFMAGGLAGGAYALLTALGIDPSVVAQVTTVIDQIGIGIQTGLAILDSIITGFMAGGVGGGISNLLTALGVDPAIVVQAQTVIGQIGTAIQTGIGAVKAAIAGFMSGGLMGGVGGFLTALGIDPAVVSQVQAVLGQIGSAIQSGIGVAVGVVVTAASLIKQNWQAVVGAFAGVGGMLIAVSVLGAIGAALTFLLSPIALVIAAGALLGAAWATNFGNIRGIVTGVATVIGGVLVTAFNVLSGVVGYVISNWQTLSTAASTIGGILATVGGIVGGVLVGGFKVLSGIIGFVVQNWQIFASVLGAVGAVLAGGAILTGITAIVGAFTTFTGIISGVIALVGMSGGVFGVLATFLAMPLVPIALLVAAIGGLAVAWATNMGGIRDKTGVYIENVKANFDQLAGYVQAIGQFLSTPVDLSNPIAAAQTMRDAWGRMTERMGEVDTEFQSRLANIKANAANGGQAIVASAAQTADIVRDQYYRMPSDADTATQLMKAVTEGNFAAIPGIVGGNMDKVRQLLGDKVADMVAKVSAGAAKIRAEMASIAGAAGMSERDEIRSSARTALAPATAAEQGIINSSLAADRAADNLRQSQGSMSNLGSAAGGAGAAAKTAEDKIKSANDALQSTIQTVTDLNEMLKSGLDGLTVGEGADKIVQLASQVAVLGARFVEVFVPAMAGISEDASKAAQTGASAIGSVSQAMGSLVGMLPKLVEFLQSDAWSAIQAAPGRVVAAAQQIIAIGAQIADSFMSAMGSVSEESAKSAQNGAAVVGAASQALGALVGLLPKLWEFINLPEFDEIMAAKGQIAAAAAQISSIGKAISDAFLGAMGNVSAETAATAQNAGTVISATTSSISSLIDTIKKIVDFTADVGYAAVLAEGDARNNLLASAQAIIGIGVAMMAYFLEAAGSITAKQALAAERLGKALESTTKGIGSVLEVIEKVLAFVADGWNAFVMFNANMRVWAAGVGTLLIDMGMQMFQHAAEAGSKITQLSINSAKRLSDGLSSLASIGTVIDVIDKILAFVADGHTAFVMFNSQMRIWASGVGTLLIDMGMQMLTHLSAAGTKIAQISVDAAKRLGDALGSVGSAVSSILDAVQRIIAALADSSVRSAVMTETGRKAVTDLTLDLFRLGYTLYEQFNYFAASVPSIATTAAKNFGDAIGSITSSVTGLLDIVDRLTAILGDTAATAAIRSEAGRKAITDLTLDLFRLAWVIYEQFNFFAVNVPSTAVTASKNFKDALSNVVGAVMDVMSVTEAMLGFAKNAVLRAIISSQGARTWFADFAGNMMRLGNAIITAFVDAEIAVSQDVVDATGRFASALQNTADAITSTFELTKLLVETLSFNFEAVNWSKAWQNLIGLAKAAVEYTRGVSGVAVAIANIDTSGLAPLKEAIDNVLGIAKTSFDLIKLLVDTLKFDFGAPDWDQAWDNLLALTLAAYNYSRGAALTALAIREIDTSGLTPLREAVDAVLGIVQSTFDLIKLLLEPPSIPDVSDGSTLAIFLSNLTAFARRVTELAVAATNGFVIGAESGLNALAGAVGDAYSVWTSALDVIKLLVEPQGIPNVSEGSPLAKYLFNLAAFAKNVTAIALLAVGAFAIAKESGLSALAGAIGDALSVWTGALDVIKLLIEPPGIPELGGKGNTLGQFLRDLAIFADEVTTIALTAVGSFVVAKDSGLSALAGAIGDAVSVWGGALDVIKLLVELPTIPELNGGKGNILARFIANLAVFAEDVTRIALLAVGAFVIAKDSGLGALAGAIGDAVSVWGSALDVIKLLIEPPHIPDIEATSVLNEFLYNLAKFAEDATRLALEAVGTFEVATNSGLSALAGAVGDALSVWNGALDTIKLLIEPPHIPDIEATSVFNEFLYNLAKFAEDATRLALEAVGTFEVATNSGLSVLASAVGDAVSVWGSALDVIKLLIEPPHIPDIESTSVFNEFLYNLAQFAKDATRLALEAVGTFEVATNSGLSVLATAVGDALSVWNSALDTIKLLIKSPHIPDIEDTSVLNEFLYNLAKFAEDAARLALDAVGAFELAKDNGLSALAGSIGDALSVWENALKIIQLLVKPPTLPQLGSGTGSLRQFLVDLTDFAQSVTEVARDAAAEFVIAENSGLSQLASAVGDTLSVIEGGLNLKKLMAAVLAFTGIDFSILEPKLKVLFASVISVAQLFARMAADSGIGEAFAEASSRVAGVFGDAAGSIKEAFEVAALLLDPETQIPSIGQIQQKLTATLNLIGSVVAQFAAKAESMVDAGLDVDLLSSFAEGVQSVFDGIGQIIEAVKAAADLNIGTAGFNNIDTLLQYLFGLMDNVSQNAGMVNEVTASISTLLGGIQNLVAGGGTAAGVSFMSAWAAAITANAALVQNAVKGVLGGVAGQAGNQGSAMATPSGAPESGGGPVTYITNNYKISNIAINQAISGENAPAQANQSIYGFLTLY